MAMVKPRSCKSSFGKRTPSMIRKSIRTVLPSVLLFASWSAAAVPAFKSDSATEREEAVYYPIVTFEIPKEIVLEAGALAMLPDGRLAVSTRRGEIYLVEEPLTDDP